MACVALLDIEGTIADIAFVKRVLFPYAREALPEFVRANRDRPAVDGALAATARQADLATDDLDAIIDQLLAWIDADVKATPLKSLQGMVWKHGYESGAFRAHLYPDAFEWIERQHAAGAALYIYSSGSIQAQKLYFGHTEYGDLGDRFNGFFDTTSGAKTEPGSYRSIAARIAAETGAEPGSITFFSDVPAELEAARAAGLNVIQIVRPGTEPDARFRGAPDFTHIELETS